MSESVDDFLAHYGVKGMRWGYRRPSAQTVSVVKKVAKEVAFGAVGPAAVIAGLGPPITLALGVTIAAARQVASTRSRQAAASTTAAKRALMSEVKNTKMSTMRASQNVRKRVTSS